MNSSYIIVISISAIPGADARLLFLIELYSPLSTSRLFVRWFHDLFSLFLWARFPDTHLVLASMIWQ